MLELGKTLGTREGEFGAMLGQLKSNFAVAPTCCKDAD